MKIIKGGKKTTRVKFGDFWTSTTVTSHALTIQDLERGRRLAIGLPIFDVIKSKKPKIIP